MTKLAFVLLGLALMLATASARGAGRRIALVHGDPELERALELALAPWDVETVPLDMRLAEELDAARVEAADLARRLGLAGVVWVAVTLQESRLAVFDAHTGKLTVRPLPEFPPFASTTAAGLALSVKTALRSSVEQASEQASEQPSEPAPPPRVPTPDRVVPASAPPMARAALRATLEAAWIADKKAEPRWGLGGTLWLGPSRRLGASLRLSAGSGVSVNAPGFAGRYRDLALGLGVELRWLDTGSVSSAFGLGAALRTAMLDGTLSDGSHTAVTRYDPSVDAAFRLDVRVTGVLLVGLDVSSSFLGRYQRFLAAGQPVFAPFRLIPSAGVSFGLALF